ncbi:head decoration protein [Pseudomonas capsici]|uniref:head decoration protein n=1 Tax=Pseudomonas capsici TaxID=2810614 RepID=UPI0021F1DFE5|nr:head decoration protein [Pseudomonas capsici]MCV4272300.1 head decoration protein [Pseudomonas capsici]
MATSKPAKQVGDLLLVEVAAGWTKEKITLLAGAIYPFGSVLAKVSGKYQVLDPTGTGAAKKAVAVLTEHVDATTGDAPGVVIARGGVLDLNELTWPAGITDAQKSTALEELIAVGIVARAAL